MFQSSFTCTSKISSNCCMNCGIDSQTQAINFVVYHLLDLHIISMQHTYHINIISTEPPSVPVIRALRDYRPTTYFDDAERLSVECFVHRVYPVNDLAFQLTSAGVTVSTRETGRISINGDGTFFVKVVFNVTFNSSYSADVDGLRCDVCRLGVHYYSHNLTIFERLRKFMHLLKAGSAPGKNGNYFLE